MVISLLQITVNGYSQNIAAAQQERYVSGRITDAENAEPITGASVFFDNTTAGISTDLEGRYRLKIPGEGSYRLTISHVGYQTAFMDIVPGTASTVFDAALQANQMEEVTVSVRVRFRRNDINLFWRTILGKNPSRRTIQATNPETVYYYYNPETQILKVTCREPLQIVNYETGYHIHYVLNRFTHDYNTGITDWDYQSAFTELQPDNLRQKDNWDKSRKSVYDISLTKFIKSLYNNSLMDDGFVLADINRNSDPDVPYRLSLLNGDDFLFTVAPDKSKTMRMNRLVLLVCYGRPVTHNDQANLLNSKQEAEQPALPARNIPVSMGKTIDLNENKFTPSDPQRMFGELLDKHGKIRNILQGDSIRIFPDGTFTNTLSMGSVNNSGSLMGLSMRLPIEYATETLTSPTMQEALADNAFDFNDIAHHFAHQLSVFPQEKIHLHTDRNFYVPGERIWFKAYITDAASHQPASESRYLYAELIDPRDSLVNRVMIRPENDMFHGHLFLSEIIPEGNYTLRAYTRYMENLGDDYFFKKNIRIGNLSSETENVGSSGIGGHDTVRKEAFPQFELPQPDPRAYALTVSQHNKRISVGVQNSAQNPEIPCYLLAYCRGVLLYFAAWDRNNEFVAFSEEELPAGVIHFVLFDEQMNPLSERLVFSKNSDEAKVDFQTDKASYEKREKIMVTLSISDSDGNLMDGHLSVAVTDDMDIAVDASTTILSSLLLSSELKGYIENPAWYLQDDTQSATALDDLMMTHGWRRYNIPEIAKGNSENPTIAHQRSQEISGSVKRQGRSSSVANSDVLIQVTDDDFGISATDEAGRFTFQDFEYPDSTTFFLRALTDRSNDRFELVVDGESFPKPIYAPQSPSVKDIKAEQIETESKSELDAFLAKAEKRAKFDEDMWMLHLSEVKITASRIERKEEPRLQFWANSSADATLRREDIEKSAYLNVADYLKQISGVQVSVDPSDGTGRRRIINIRATSSFQLDSAPLIIIDGIPQLSDFNISDLSVDEVESIDVFKGVSTTAFGVRGANGVISITTKTEGSNNSAASEELNYTVYTPLGYQKPVEFYAPKYETLEAKHSVIPDYRTTIFWKPDLVISNENEASFEFYASDFKTTYSVVIEGLTTDGKIVRHVEKIRVE